MVLLACWHRWHAPVNETAVAAATLRNQQLSACQDEIRPRLNGPVDGWRIADEQPNAEGRRFTFAANFNAGTTFYHCQADAAGAVLAVDGPE